MAKKKGKPRGKPGDAERMARMREALAARRRRLAGGDVVTGQGGEVGASASASPGAGSVGYGVDPGTCPECQARNLEKPHRPGCSRASTSTRAGAGATSTSTRVVTTTSGKRLFISDNAGQQENVQRDTLDEQQRLARDPMAWIDENIQVSELGKPFKLAGRL